VISKLKHAKTLIKSKLSTAVRTEKKRNLVRQKQLNGLKKNP